MGLETVTSVGRERTAVTIISNPLYAALQSS